MTTETRTPTETLMTALSDCENADNVIIIIDKADEIAWFCSTPKQSIKLALIEFVRTCLHDNIVQARKDDE